MPASPVAQTPVLPVHALPQLPQLAELVSSTHASPQRLYPTAHWNEQTPAEQTGTALATLMVQGMPQPPQFSTEVPPPSHSAASDSSGLSSPLSAASLVTTGSTASAVASGTPAVASWLEET